MAPILAAVSLDDAGHPLHGKLATVRTFSFASIADWSQTALARCCEVLSNLESSFSGTFHALRFDKYPDRYLGAFSYRFNRRFDLAAMTERVLHALCQCTARPQHLLRHAAELSA
jgi:hypothetical protein